MKRWLEKLRIFKRLNQIEALHIHYVVGQVDKDGRFVGYTATNSTTHD